MSKCHNRIRSGAPPPQYDTKRHIESQRRAAKRFIAGILGGDKMKGNLQEQLDDGVVLCKVAAKLDGGKTKWTEKPTPAQRKANLAAFAASAKAAGADTRNLTNFNNVVNVLAHLEASATKAGKYTAPKPKVAKTAYPVSAGCTRLEAAAPTQADFKLFNAVANPARPLRHTREAYLGNVDMSTLPEAFFLRVLGDVELFDSLTLAGFKSGLELLQKNKTWIIGTRHERTDLLQALTFLRFIGFQAIPTCDGPGGFRIVTDERCSKFIPKLLGYWNTAAKAYVGAK